MKNVTAVLLIALLIFPMALAQLTFAVPHIQAASQIYLDPSVNVYSTTNATVGTLFNVTVKVNDVPPIESLINPGYMGAAAWQVYMEFNDSVINVTRWFEPKNDPQYIFYGNTTSPNPTPPNPGYIHVGGKGVIQVASNLFPTPPAVNGTSGPGPFKLCILTFNITKIPDSFSGSLSSTLHLSPADTFLLDVDGETIPGTVEDGSYSIVYAPPPPSIWLETTPSTYEAVVPSQAFNVTINVMNVSEADYLIGVQFEIHYSTIYLEVLNTYNGSFLGQWATHGTFWVSYDDPGWHSASHIGRLVVGEIYIPDDSGNYDLPVWPSGQGDIATVTFRPKVHEAYNASLTPLPLFEEQSFIDKDGNYIAFATPKGTEYTYNPLALPVIAVSPTTAIASHFGENCPIDITITGLSDLWKLTYLEFKLQYNATYLNAIDASEGLFMSQFGNTTFVPELGADYVKASIEVTPSGPFPSGNGTLATITFNATSRPPAMSDLTFSDADLVMQDPDGYPVYATLQNGNYVMHEVLVHPITVGESTFNVTTVSDDLVDPVPMEFDASHRLLDFNVSGWGTAAFVDVIIPNDLIHSEPIDNWFVLVDSSRVTPTVTALNSSYTKLTINFDFTNEPVFIFGTWAIPEMTTNIMMLVLVLATLVSIGPASIVYTKRKKLALYN
jgi:hypothetical protein